MSFKRPFQAVPIKLGKRYRARRRREQLGRMAVPVGVLSLAAIVGAVVGVGLPANLGFSNPSYDGVLTGCAVTDGDTIRCGDERIRLLGIDAPELPGHCREGRDCAPGDAYASKQSLTAGLSGTVHIQRYGEDRYGRTLAVLSGSAGDLSCWQLEHGQAIYKPQWDNAGKVARICAKSQQANVNKPSANSGIVE